jgi:hypothetical protein
MSDDTSIMTVLQSLDLPYQQRLQSTLSLNDPAVLASLLSDECTVAMRVLHWLDTQSLFIHYYGLIESLTPDYDIIRSRSARFNVWMNCDACLWDHPYKIKSADGLLWQFALIRLSAYLKTAH